MRIEIYLSNLMKEIKKTAIKMGDKLDKRG